MVAISAARGALPLVPRKGRNWNWPGSAHCNRGLGPQTLDRALALRGNRPASGWSGIEGLERTKGRCRESCCARTNQGGNVIVVRQGEKSRSKRLILAPWNRQARACGILVADPNMIPPDIRLWRPLGYIKCCRFNPGSTGRFGVHSAPLTKFA